MKKNYEAPELELVLLAADVITTSGTYTDPNNVSGDDTESDF